MEFFFIVVGPCLIMFSILCFVEGTVPLPTPLKKAIMPSYRLSPESNWVMDAWNGIPQDQRPDDPTELLKALDARYSLRPKSHPHHGNHFTEALSNVCQCFTGPGDCKRFPEHQQMRRRFVEISREIQRRERALEKKRREDNFVSSAAEVAVYLERLRDETEIQKQVTKELV